MMELSEDQKWGLAGLGAAVVAGLLIRSGIRAGWRAAGEEPPPLNPVAPDSTWREAVLFSLATGLTVGLARLGARAAVGAARRYENGSLPLPWR